MNEEIIETCIYTTTTTPLVTRYNTIVIDYHKTRKRYLSMYLNPTILLVKVVCYFVCYYYIVNGGYSQGTFRRIANYANGWFLWRIYRRGRQFYVILDHLPW